MTIAMMPEGVALMLVRRDDLIRDLLMDGQPAEKTGSCNNKEQADGLPDRCPEDPGQVPQVRSLYKNPSNNA